MGRSTSARRRVGRIAAVVPSRPGAPTPRDPVAEIASRDHAISSWRFRSAAKSRAALIRVYRHPPAHGGTGADRRDGHRRADTDGLSTWRRFVAAPAAVAEQGCSGDVFVGVPVRGLAILPPTATVRARQPGATGAGVDSGGDRPRHSQAMSSGTRRFEMVEGSASKFWEVTIVGNTYTVTYGRIGSAGLGKTTVAASPEAAAAEVAKLVREKLKKGYQELGGAGPTWRPPVHISSHEHVERFLNYKVAAFDPEADCDGDEGRRALPALRDLDKLAFAVSASYDDSEEVFLARLDALLADPRVGELRALVIGNWFGDVSEAAPAALYQRLVARGAALRSLKGLFLGDIIQEECEISWIHQGDVAPVVHALPSLEELIVRGGDGLRFRGLRHPGLTSLTVQSGGLAAETVRDIVGADLPALRRLTLWLGVDDYGGNSSLADLAPLLAGDHFPALEHLGLQDSEQADEIAAAVARSPLLARLQGLDLSMGTLSDEGGEALLASPHLRNLRHLNLRYHFLSPAMMARFRGLGIEVNVGDRQTEDEEDRFVEVAE
jgi:predicted DNA-binding WGR domain protein